MQTEAQNGAERNAERFERLARRNRPVGPHYKWVALTNTTLGVLMATIDSSIVLISLPVIFKGIHIDPLAPGETGYFLWLLLGYMVVTATLLVTQYIWFALILFMFGIGQGMFSSPNTSSVMGSVPPEQRGVASGMRSTLQNSGTIVSLGVFFSLITSGLATSLPTTLSSGLINAGVPASVAAKLAHLPPTSALFAVFLGYNPMGTLLPLNVQYSKPCRLRNAQCCWAMNSSPTSSRTRCLSACTVSSTSLL